MLDSRRFTKSEQEVIPKIREIREWFRIAGLGVSKGGRSDPPSPERRNSDPEGHCYA